MSDFILPFAKINKKDVGIAGGKGASLGEMTQAGIPVPPGFIILAGAFDRFLEEADINVEIDAQLDKINYQDINSVDRTSNVIRDLISDAKMPKDLADLILKNFKKLRTKYIAVRSSATAEDSSVASWAGELETYLNTTKASLLKNTKKCWSSLFTPRAIFYACEKRLYRNVKSQMSNVKNKRKVRRKELQKTSKISPVLKCGVSVAVVVQKMIDSEVAGVCFTVHPVTRDPRQMIIEAGWGLGEAIVLGQITPDSYVVDKMDFSILDININKQKKMIVRTPASENTSPREQNKIIVVPSLKQEKQKLPGGKIIELAKLCLRIEKHYQVPQDIEWAYKGGKFYIVQSRPITTL